MKSIMIRNISLITIIVVLLMIISPHFGRKSRRLRREVPQNNKFFRFYWGIVYEILPKNEKNKEQCLPAGWLNKDPSKEDIENVTKTLISLQAIASRLTTVLSKKVEEACADRPSLIAYITKKINQKPEAKKRFFAQLEKESKDTPKPHIKPFDVIAIDFRDLKKALSGFMTLPISNEALSIFKCLGEKYEHVPKIKDLVNTYVDNYAKITKNDDKSTEVVIEALCNWQKMLRSVHFLNASFKVQNHLTVWQGYGSFFGLLAAAISGQQR